MRRSVATASAERIWFYFLQDKQEQVGPLLENELLSAINGGLVTEDDYIFRDGFSDWLLARDLPELSESIKYAKKKIQEEKRIASKRAKMNELVVVHNGSKIATGTVKNISLTGVFIETKDKNVFKVNDEIKLTLKEGKGLGKPVNLKGKIVRVSSDKEKCSGYGIELQGLNNILLNQISDFVERHCVGNE